MPIPTLKERPILNSIYMPGALPEPRSFDLPTLVYWVKKTPECIGILKRIATDIVTNISFVPIESKTIGRPSKTRNISKETKAENFARKTNYRKKLIALVIDKLITGDYYAWIGKIPDSQISQVAKEVYSDFGLTFKEFEVTEDLNTVNTIEIVPSSMTTIKHDNFKITKYVQKNKSNPIADREFNPDEIIHQRLIDIDGSIYGFSPMEAGYETIRTINSIKDFAYYYFRNGAKLDRAWKFIGNVDANFIKKFEETLKVYKSMKRSHGDIVLANADRIEIENLSESEKDMQYRQLAIYSTGVLAFSFNMPADILSSILGADIKSAAGSSDIEDAGYNRNIEQAQRDEEDTWNERFWMPFFGVKMYLDRSFRQDQIRLTQDRAMNVSVAEFLFKHKYPIKDEFFIDIFHIPREYLIEGNIKREIEMEQAGISAGKPIKGEATQAYSASKKKQQEPQSRNNPPSGKEFSTTFVDSKVFLNETRKWGIRPNSPLRVRVMTKGDLVHLKFAIPHTGEELRTTISKEVYVQGEYMNLSPISVPAIWDIEGKEMKTTILKPNIFMNEAKRFGTGPYSQLRIRVMEQENKVYMKFTVPNTMEELHTVISKEEYEKGAWMNIVPVSVPSIWVVPPEINLLEMM